MNIQYVRDAHTHMCVHEHNVLTKNFIVNYYSGKPADQFYYINVQTECYK